MNQLSLSLSLSLVIESVDVDDDAHSVRSNIVEKSSIRAMGCLSLRSLGDLIAIPRMPPRAFTFAPAKRADSAAPGKSRSVARYCEETRKRVADKRSAEIIRAGTVARVRERPRESSLANRFQRDNRWMISRGR